MYSTCTFCNQSLGRNDGLESFPIGRRIAFDPERGRLWVVCRACERWNLSPIEERWEVLELCEREYRDARLRASTENIGLAKLSEGLELVRIGQPQRPEFAAWRYGDQFGRRQRQMVVKVGVGLAGLGAIVAGTTAMGFGIFGLTGLIISRAQSIVKGGPDDVVARIAMPHGTSPIKRKQLAKVKLVHTADSWALRIPQSFEERMLNPTMDADRDTRLISGDSADAALRQMLPAINRFGANAKRVKEAVGLLEQYDPATYITRVAHEHARYDQPSLPHIPFSVRLAIEMASHEEIERRALEGELAILEDAWRDAEVVASISDDLFLPDSFTDRLRAFGRRR